MQLSFHKLQAFCLAFLMSMGLGVAASAQDLALNVSDDGYDPITAGATISYAVRIDNSGNTDSTATSIKFAIPANTQFTGVTGDLTGCSAAPLNGPGEVTCDVPVLAPQASLSAQVNLVPEAAGVIDFMSTIAGDASITENTTVSRGADLGVTLTGDTQHKAGEITNFSAVVHNYGPYSSDGATLKITLPTGLSPDVTLPSGCAISGGTISCSVSGPIAVGDEVSFDFSTQITTENASTISIPAALENADPSDPDGENDSKIFDITVTEGTDVSMGKSRSPAGSLLVGDTVTFTLSPRYAGTPPTSASITDVLPANYEYVLPVTTGTGWSCDAPSGQTLTCDYAGTEADVANYTTPITVTAKTVSAGNDIVNTAEISADYDVRKDNNTAKDSPAIIQAPVVNLVPSKIGPDRGLVTVGNSYDYTLSTRNNGNAPFWGTLSFTDTLPAGMTAQTFNAPTGWTCTPLPAVGSQDVTCETNKYTESNPLLPGATSDKVVLSVEITQEGSLSNKLTVTSPDYDNPDDPEKYPLENPNGSSTTVNVESGKGPNVADLRLTKKLVSPGPFVSGQDPATFELEVINDGSAEAENIELEDELNDIVFANASDPGATVSTVSGLATGLSCTVTRGSGFKSDVRCTATSLPKCTQGVDCPKIQITTLVGDVGTKTNTASAYSLKTPDPDTSNNTASASYTVNPMTDVTVTKVAAVADGGNVQAGLNLTYVITAKVVRDGRSGADGVKITDSLPHGLRFVSASPSTGSCTTAPSSGALIDASNDQLTCNLGDIDNGSQQTVQVKVIPTTAQAVANATITNSVDVATTTPESDSSNNSAQISHKVVPPSVDLLINKSDGPDPLEINTNTVYTVTATNNGPSNAFNVDIIDTFPSEGMSYVSHGTPSAGTCSVSGTVTDQPGGSLSCSVPYLAAGQSVSVTVTMKGLKRGKWTNAARVESDETRAGYDIQAANNVTTEDTTVRTRSDLQVTKTVSASEVDLWEGFNWTVNVASLTGPGLGLSERVVLSDTLPANMVLTGVPTPAVGSCTGTVGQRDISCNLGDINDGDSVDVTVPVKVTSVTSDGQSFTNTASAKSDSFESNSSNNSGSASVKVNATSLKGTVWRDFNNDGTRDAHDSGVSGISVTATRVAGAGEPAFSKTLSTGSDGSYDFTLLPPGTYTISYSGANATTYDAGSAIPGDQSGTADGTSRITGATLAVGSPGTGYNFTLVPIPSVVLTKASPTRTLQSDGSYKITYQFKLQNKSQEPISNVDLSDALTAGFGTFTSGTPAPGEFTVETPTLSNGFTFNAGYDGTSTPLLASGGTIAANTTATLNVIFHVNPPLPRTGTTLSLKNTGTMDATGDYSGTALNDDASHTRNLTFTPKVTLDKTATLVMQGSTPAPGDQINYTFTVKNTGNTPLQDVKIADPLTDLVWDTQGPIALLNPGDSDTTTYTAHYILKQTDIDGDKVENTATVTGQWGVSGGNPLTTSDNDTADISGLSKPSLTVVKAIDSNTISDPRTEVNETIRYKFTVTNTGNVALSNVTLSDELSGIAPDPTGAFTIGNMPINGTPVTVYADYKVTQDDIDAGQVDNKATVEGTDPTNGTVNASSDEVTQPLYRDPSVRLSKVVDSGTVKAVPQAGDEIVWNITVKNTGNVTLKNVVVSDPKTGATVQGSPLISLAPGAESTDAITVKYKLTQDDINAGEVQNQAQLKVTPPGSAELTVPSGNDPSNPNEDPTVVPLVQKPSVALLKTVTTDLSGPLKPGDKIAYSFTIKNTGNVPIGSLALTDSLPGFVFDDATLSGLVLQPASATAAAEEVTVSGEYTLTPADLDAGKVTNTAKVTGNSTVGAKEPVEDTSGTAFDNDDATDATLKRDPAIALVKTVDTANSVLSDPPKAGDVLHYDFAVHNTGNVTLSNVDVKDLVTGVTVSGSRTDTLAAGDVDTTSFSATYTLTQDDIDAGSFANRAEASGDGNGDSGVETVKDQSGTDTTNDDDTVFTIDRVPTMTVEKTADASALSANPVAGEKISYKFKVTNTGQVTLRDLVLSDPRIGLSLADGTVGDLAPGGSKELTASYTLTQADIDAYPPEIRNTASVNGGYGSDGSPTDLPKEVPSNEVVVDLPSSAGITLVKTQVAPLLTDTPQADDTISYAFTVKNTGNVTLSGVTVSEELTGATVSGGPITLAPGADDSTTFTASYDITQDDIARGYVDNTAVASGSYGDPSDPSSVRDTSGTSVDNDDPTRVTIAQKPAIELEKFADLSSLANPDAPQEGEEVLYHFKVHNSGNMVVRGVTVSDDKITFDTPATTPFDLAPGETRESVFTGRYSLTLSDIESGSVTNSAKVDATATTEDGTKLPVTDDATIKTDLKVAPSIALVKTINTAKSTLSDPPAKGDVVHFDFAVTNTGNVTLSNLQLSDDYLPDVSVTGSLASLAPGVTNSDAFSATYTLKQSDIDAGGIENQAKVSGTFAGDGTNPQTVQDLSGTDLSNDDATPLTLDRKQGLSIVKSADDSKLSDPPLKGDVISYSFVITNTGNTSLTNVTLSDPLTGINLPVSVIPTLAPGASETLTGSYTVSQDDIRAGKVENQASVTGTFTDPATGTPTSLPPVASEEIVVPLTQKPGIAVIKTASSAISDPAVIGEKITYTFTVTNTGNTVLQNVELDDPLTGLVPTTSFAIGTMQPGAVETRTATYAILQDDIDQGQVINQATATGEFDDGSTQTPVKDLSGPTNDDDAQTVVPVAQNPGITLVKTANVDAVSDPAVVGQQISYSFAVTNTGNVTLRDVTVADPLSGLSPSSFSIATLAPGKSQTVGPALYAITQDDITAQQVENRAEATGTYGPTDGAKQISGPSQTDAGLQEATVVKLGTKPAIALVKTLDGSIDPATLKLGDEIKYDFTVINTGNVPLDQISVSDTLDGIQMQGAIANTLMPGGQDSTSITATYKVTQADIDAGKVVNSAEVSGRFDDGSAQPPVVTDTSGLTKETDDPVVTPLTQHGAIALVKASDTSKLQDPPQVGDEISYSFAITNTGDVTLSNVTLEDAMLGAELQGSAIASLAPGATDSSSYKAVHKLTQAEIDAGRIENQAKVTGGYGDDGSGAPIEVSDLSGADNDSDAPDVIDITQKPGIAVIKTADDSKLSVPAIPGQEISYSFKITNTGNVTLTDVTLSDALAGVSLQGGPIATLAPGAVDDTTFTATYPVTADDIIATKVTNSAEASGAYTPPGGSPTRVKDSSGATNGDDDPTVVDIGYPELAFAIGVANLDDRDGNGIIGQGDAVEFSFTVTNTGTVPLEDANVDGSTLSLPLSGLVCQPISLAVGESAVLQCTGADHVITAEDASAGSISLEGDAQAVSSLGVVVRASSAAAAVPVQLGGVTLEKVAGVSTAVIGDVVPYTITIGNDADGVAISARLVDTLPEGFVMRTGTVRLDGVAVTPVVSGRRIVLEPVTVKPGQERTLTMDVFVSSSAQPGLRTNRARLVSPITGRDIAPEASATVRIEADAVFQCSTILGRVFDDHNQDGHMDPKGGEKGLPNVRLISPRGVAIHTDAQGRFSVPCAALPRNIGGNYMLRLDERTLPSGYRLTTENPRVVRVTPGMITRLDFGATLSRLIRIDLADNAFDGSQMRAPLKQGIATLVEQVRATPAMLRITYQLAPGEPQNLAQQRIKAVQAELRRLWPANGRYELNVETRILRVRASK